MEFLIYKGIKTKLKKRGLLFKKPSIEEATSQFYSLARQLDSHKLYAGLCHLAITSCQGKTGQVGAYLNAARTFSQANYEIISLDDHIRAVIWIYTEALLICDGSFIKPICLEMGKFYEAQKMYQEAAECFKQSMSISRCVYNLILSKRYKSALDELKNCPSHLMTIKDHTSMFLLELLLNENGAELSNQSSLQHLLINSQMTSTSRGLLPIDDHLFDLNGLLESLFIMQQDKKDVQANTKDSKIKEAIIDKLSAFLDPAQIQLLHLIVSSET